ncbi:MAG: SOS response-associated peptidase [Dehalococcoidia bacterium]
MCGRFVYINIDGIGVRFRLVGGGRDKSELQLAFGDFGPPRSSYNVAPTQTIPVVTNVDGQRRLELMRWGLIPSWWKQVDPPKSSFNARDDRLTGRGMWSGPFRRRRCLVPANGFYEWTGEKGSRRPLFIHRRDGDLFAFAGLFDTWVSPEGSMISSCAIITTSPNSLMEPVHNRMPVILDEEQEAVWLDPLSDRPQDLLRHVQPREWPEFEAYPVSIAVGNVRNNSPELIERVA